MRKGFVTQLGELIDKSRESSSPATLSKWLPSRGTVLFVLLAFTLFIWAQRAGAIPGLSSSAVSTNTISYQGRLADINGDPLTGYYNLEFRLYDAPVGGVPLWDEFWTGGNSVQVSDGLFNVMLGSLNPALASAIEGRQNLFLGITVGTDSEMAPRIQLGSVPFAMQSFTVPDGSITPVKIANGAVTADKLSLQKGTFCLPNEVNMQLPGNWVRQPVPGATLTFSSDYPSQLLVWTSGSYHFVPINYYGGAAITLDDTEVVANITYFANTAWDAFSIIRQIPLSAGTHTLGLSMFAQGPGTLTVGGQGLNTCIEYILLN